MRRFGSASFGTAVLIWSGLAAALTAAPRQSRTFGEDVAFLKEHTEVILLSHGTGEAEVVVAPQYQGRVMTSTTGGAEGPSYGWIHREAIASGRRQAHINVFGGEDRFWLGPEGGQYSIFFKAGDPFDLEHWQVPEPIDWGPWEVVSQSGEQVRFRQTMTLINHSGTRFELRVDRTVRLLGAADLIEHLPVKAGSHHLLDGRVVAFESANTITNTGSEPWRKETGLLSIWILGMFNPTPRTTVVIPFKAGPEVEKGPAVNDAYFGKVPGDRLAVGRDVLFFRGDGEHRSKIGIARPRARPIMGSYDGANRVLTLVQYTLPPEAVDYVNSMWEIQDRPYRGDVVNSYNDGPPEPGRPPLGPFYELESSSPAAALAPGESLTHVHRTIHLEGPEAELDRIARATLGIGLARITNAFK
ncbi:MAG: DUF6786 family protein [Acidobacteriota bacterium]